MPSVSRSWDVCAVSVTLWECVCPRCHAVAGACALGVTQGGACAVDVTKANITEPGEELHQ